MHVDHHVHVFFLGADPLGVASDHAGVVFVNGMPGEVLPIRRHELALPLHGQRIKRRWCEEDDISSRRFGLLHQGRDPVLISLETALIERVIDPVIHPITGHHDVGSDFLQSAIQALVHTGSGEGMRWLRQAAARFAGQSEIDPLEVLDRASMLLEMGFQHGDVVAGMG